MKWTSGEISRKDWKPLFLVRLRRKTASDAEKAAWTRVDEKGKKLIINKSTGVILVTDYPVNLNKIASYLETVEGSAQRQVTIQAKIFEVILSDENKEGINWKVIESLPRSLNLSWGLTDISRNNRISWRYYRHYLRRY